MGAQAEVKPKEVLERMHRAVNQHDLEAFVACFHPEYRSEQPVHPNRGFGGREQVRTNWKALFEGIPDFHAELLATAAGVTRCGRNGAGPAPELLKRRSTSAE